MSQITEPRDTGGPAFPSNAWLQSGMTLRDHFAGLAMQAHIVASMQALAREYLTNPDAVTPVISMAAYEMADSMLAERAKS